MSQCASPAFAQKSASQGMDMQTPPPRLVSCSSPTVHKQICDTCVVVVLRRAADPATPIHECILPVPTVNKLAMLMCRHSRLGAGCVASMGMLPEELWLRIFHLARTITPYPNAVELGPPPGSNATSGVINAPTPHVDGAVEPEPDARRCSCALAFGPQKSQLEVYESLGFELLESALDGYRATILAYGPRGSGKRHTIEGGSASTFAERGAEGLLQRAIRHACLEARRRPGGLLLRLSCFAIYRRQAYDMLALEAPAKTSISRQDTAGERVPAYVDGLCAPSFSSVEEAFALVEAAKGAQMRLPVCDACANWLRELDTVWCLYFATAPCGTSSGSAEATAPSAAPAVPPALPSASAPPGPKWLGSFSLVTLAACGERARSPTLHAALPPGLHTRHPASHATLTPALAVRARHVFCGRSTIPLRRLSAIAARNREHGHQPLVSESGTRAAR